MRSRTRLWTVNGGRPVIIVLRCADGATQEVLLRVLILQLSFCTSEPSPVVEGLGDGLVRPPPERPGQDKGRLRRSAGELEPRD